MSDSASIKRRTAAASMPAANQPSNGKRPRTEPDPRFAAAPASSSGHEPAIPASLIALLDEICHRLHLPGPPARLAAQLLTPLALEAHTCTEQMHLNTASNHSAWVASCVYLAVLIARTEPDSLPKSASLPSLTFILTACKLKVDEFMRQLMHCSMHCIKALKDRGFGVAPLEARINEAQESLVYSIALYHKYSKMFAAIIQPRVDSAHHSMLQTNLFGGGWLLFLVSKAEFQSGSCDRYSLLILMLAVIRITLFNVIMAGQSSSMNPAEALKLSLDIVAAASSDASSGIEPINQLDVQWMQPFMKELVASQSLKLPVPADSSPFCIFDPSVFTSNVTALGNILDDQFHVDSQSLGFDERVFLVEKYLHTQIELSEGEAMLSAAARTASSSRRLFAESSANSHATQAPITPRAVGQSSSSASFASLPQPPSFNMIASPSKLSSTALAFSPAIRSSSTSLTRKLGTSSAPFTRIMESVSWLTTTFASVPDTPSSVLQALLAGYKPDVTENIQSVVNSLAATVVFRDWNFEEAPIKRSLAKKLYYTVLHNLVAQEPPPSSAKQSPPVWLTRRSVHVPLLALAFELVHFAYRTNSREQTSREPINTTAVSITLVRLFPLHRFGSRQSSFAAATPQGEIARHR